MIYDNPSRYISQQKNSGPPQESMHRFKSRQPQDHSHQMPAFQNNRHFCLRAGFFGRMLSLMFLSSGRTTRGEISESLQAMKVKPVGHSKENRQSKSASSLICRFPDFVLSYSTRISARRWGQAWRHGKRGRFRKSILRRPQRKNPGLSRTERPRRPEAKPPPRIYPRANR